MSDYVIRPYIPDAAFHWLKDWIRPEMRVFEFGSGYSTLWFGKNVSEVASVENDPDYFRVVQGYLQENQIENVIYNLRPEEDGYVNSIHEFDGQFDLVFVDGRFRKRCMEQAFGKAEFAVMLDNSDAPHYSDAYEIMTTFSGGNLTDFFSFGIYPVTGELLKTPKPDEGEPLAWKASVFLKEA